ncbi:MAG: GmrSD restriction endonuclease domain-containing protein [Chitinophagaceae bacterium]
MQANSANLLTVIKGPKQFLIPIYQRTYSWLPPQCDKLFNDILKVSRYGDAKGHFMGSVVYFQENIHTISDVPKLLVIDGQQRLTTVSLLIIALSEFIRDNDVEIDTNFDKLRNYYLLNPEEESELQYKLLLTKRDKETLINLINGIEPVGEYSFRLVENYRFFKGKISKENIKEVYNGVRRLFIVDVALEKDTDNPQLIFESMNSTGLDLSQADLIRNYILMGQDIKLQTELYEKYWFPMEQSYGNECATKFGWFMRNYLSVKTGAIPKINKVYEEFKNYVQSNKAPKTITEVVQDISKFSGYYVNMALRKEAKIDLDLKKLFANILKLKVDVSYPFLMTVYNDYATEIITIDDFKEIIKLVENYVFRRAICGIPTNSLNKTFATLYKSINPSHYLESLKATFQLMENYKRFPNDTEFEKEIGLKDVYHFHSRNYLLHNLENYNRKEIVNTDDYTIEHIMPRNPKLNAKWQAMLGDNWQEVQKKYLHTLGNLTLTGYNSKLSDNPFDSKKSIEGGFDHSPLHLNSFMQKVSLWDEEKIQERAVELAARASKIWVAPNLSQEILDKYKRSEENIYTIENYEHLKGDMLELYYALKKRVLNIDASVNEEYTKLYIAFKSNTNFVDIVPQKTRLCLSLNIEFNQIDDPLGLCLDVTNKGHWGNGDIRVDISKMNELDNVMDLIQQAFDIQMENI